MAGDVQAALDEPKALPGIGPRTANYADARWSWPDAFPAGRRGPAPRAQRTGRAALTPKACAEQAAPFSPSAATRCCIFGERHDVSPPSRHAADRDAWGLLLAARSRRGLSACGFDDGQRHHPAWRISSAEPGDEVALATRQALQVYFEGRAWALPPLDLAGTPFQQRCVWQALHIPPGRLERYGRLAGSPALGRRQPGCGAAVGRNPVSVLCLATAWWGADGSLHGLCRGLARPRALLQLEGAPV